MCRQLVQPRPGETWVVVTSAMHMPRTVACFRAAGWGDVIPYPTDFKVVLGDWDAGTVQVADNLALLDAALHEWIGLAYYRLTGRTQEWFPAPRRRLQRQWCRSSDTEAGEGEQWVAPPRSHAHSSCARRMRTVVRLERAHGLCACGGGGSTRPSLEGRAATRARCRLRVRGRPPKLRGLRMGG